MNASTLRILTLCSLCAIGCPAGEVLAGGADTVTATHLAATWSDTDSTVTFSITYNRVPDFFSVDSMGRQADSFQWYLDTLPGDNGFGGVLPWETVIRGEEIHIGGDIRIRDVVNGPGGGPGSGDWGPLVGSVPYTMMGTTQEFIVPFSMLNTPDGEFHYDVQCFRYGEWDGVLYSGKSVPGPMSGAVLLIAGGLAARRRR